MYCKFSSFSVQNDFFYCEINIMPDTVPYLTKLFIYYTLKENLRIRRFLSHTRSVPSTVYFILKFIYAGSQTTDLIFFFTLCGKIPLKVYLQVSICLKRSMYFLFLIYIIHWPLLSLQENFPMVLYLYICNRQLGTG